jgi:hypothetical protein
LPPPCRFHSQKGDGQPKKFLSNFFVKIRLRYKHFVWPIFRPEKSLSFTSSWHPLLRADAEHARLPNHKLILIKIDVAVRDSLGLCLSGARISTKPGRSILSATKQLKAGCNVDLLCLV